MEIREIHEDELGRWVEAMRAGLDEADTADGYLDWKRQSRETVWILASEDGQDVGAAIGIGGWHAPEVSPGARCASPRVPAGAAWARRCSRGCPSGRRRSATPT